MTAIAPKPGEATVDPFAALEAARQRSLLAADWHRVAFIASVSAKSDEDRASAERELARAENAVREASAEWIAAIASAPTFPPLPYGRADERDYEDIAEQQADARTERGGEEWNYTPPWTREPGW